MKDDSGVQVAGSMPISWCDGYRARRPGALSAETTGTGRAGLSKGLHRFRGFRRDFPGSASPYPARRQDQ